MHKMVIHKICSFSLKYIKFVKEKVTLISSGIPLIYQPFFSMLRRFKVARKKKRIPSIKQVNDFIKSLSYS